MRVCVCVCGMVSGRVCQMCYSVKVLILVTCTSSLWKHVCPITSLQPHSTLLLLAPFLKKPSLVLGVIVQYSTCSIVNTQSPEPGLVTLPYV